MAATSANFDPQMPPASAKLMHHDEMSPIVALLGHESTVFQALASALHPLECPLRAALLHEPLLLPSGVTISKSALKNAPSAILQWVGPPPGVHFVMGAPAGPTPDQQHATVAVTSLLQSTCTAAHELAKTVLSGNTALDKGDVATASAEFKAAIQLAEGGAGGPHEALLGLARCSAALGDPEGALARAQRAMQAAPQHWPDAAWAHARYALQLGSSVEAARSVGAALAGTALREALLRGVLARAYSAQPDALADTLPAFIQFDEEEAADGSSETGGGAAAVQGGAPAATPNEIRPPPAVLYGSSLQDSDVQTLGTVLSAAFPEQDQVEGGDETRHAARDALLGELRNCTQQWEKLWSRIKTQPPSTAAPHGGTRTEGSAVGNVAGPLAPPPPVSEGGATAAERPERGAAKRPRTDSAAAGNDGEASAAAEASVAAASGGTPPLTKLAAAPELTQQAWRRGVLSTAVSADHTLSIPRDEVSEKLLCALSCAVLFQPTTAPCGHSFTKDMLLRALDHKPQCPYCRRDLSSQLAAQSLVVDSALQQIAQEALPEEYTECAALVAKDRADSARTIPIFVCNAALPTQRCPLHVFEPRYRLMMRRAMQSGGRRFGMCAHTAGGAGWADYGTVLYIKSLRLLPDGRSLVDTVGEKRFKVVHRGQRDGYMTAQVSWVDDAAGWDQDAAWLGEGQGGANAPAPVPPPEAGEGGPVVAAPPTAPPATISIADVSAMHASGLDLLRCVRGWFTARLSARGGGEPPFLDDPSTFTWWVLDKLPVGDNILVSMLSTSTPLDRLRAIASILQVVERAEANGGGFASASGDSSADTDEDNDDDDGSGDNSSDGGDGQSGASSGTPPPL